MAINIAAYNTLQKELDAKKVKLIAVSKTKTAEEILAVYELGQRDFGENYVQELCDKQAALPKDIRWHFIGHLQSNKVKTIAPFVYLIHGGDSLKLLQEINKQATKNNRVIDCLLQVHIASEETKFGMDENELKDAIAKSADLQYICIKGLMGMASFTEDIQQVEKEFDYLHSLYEQCKAIDNNIEILSMGMSGDYKQAIEAGSNMVRIGSLLFGERK